MRGLVFAEHASLFNLKSYGNNLPLRVFIIEKNFYLKFFIKIIIAKVSLLERTKN